MGASSSRQSIARQSTSNRLSRAQEREEKRQASWQYCLRKCLPKHKIEMQVKRRGKIWARSLQLRDPRRQILEYLT